MCYHIASVSYNLYEQCTGLVLLLSDKWRNPYKTSVLWGILHYYSITCGSSLSSESKSLTLLQYILLFKWSRHLATYEGCWDNVNQSMRGTPTSQTLRQQVKMALMRLWQRHSFSMHFKWHWTHLSYTYVLCKYCMCRCYCDAVSQCNNTVWQAPSCSEFNTFDVKLSVITVCLTVIF